VMERRLRTLAQETERSLAALARGTPLRWTYRVARGALMTELFATAAQTDLVVTAALADWTPRRLASNSPVAVLLVQEPAQPGASAVAACSSALPPAEAARMLNDMQVVLGRDHDVTVALLCESAEGAARWSAEVEKRVPNMHLNVLPVRDEAELHAQLLALRRPVVVLPEPRAPEGASQAARSSRPRSRRSP